MSSYALVLPNQRERILLLRKIALFAPNLSGGGAQRIICILASHLSDAGFSVDLLLGEAYGPYLKETSPKVKVIDLNCTRMRSSFFKLVKYLREINPDYLLTSQMQCSIVSLWARRLSGAETRVIIRQPSMLRPSPGNVRTAIRLRQKILIWSAEKWAFKVIVTSQAMLDEFMSLSKIAHEKVVVIHNPLPYKRIQGRSGECVKHPWLQNGEPPVILAVGRLEHVKDFETLLRAFSLVKNSVKARLIILGEGSKRSVLEELVKALNLEDHVEMPGFVHNPYKYMRRAKVFVSSSLWEGFPNSLIEAMACGCNIVATDCEGGTSEILEHGKWGTLIPVSNPSKMSDAIVLQLSASSNCAPRLADFSVEKVVCSIVSIFEK